MRALLVLVAVLLILWALGLAGAWRIGPWIHLLLLAAVLAAASALLARRS